MNTGIRKGDHRFVEALQGKRGERTIAEFALVLGVAPNTMYQVMSATIRPGMKMMQRILIKYPDLYDLAMTGYFGPRPKHPLPTSPSPGDAPQAFGQAFKTMQGDRSNAEYAVFLGIGYLTVYTTWKANPSPDIYILQRIVAKIPELYDLAAAVHFGPRPESFT